MSKFRHKPVEVEAFQWQGGDEAWRRLNRWLDALGYEEGSGTGEDGMWVNDDDSLTLCTLDGDLRLDVGGWIVQAPDRQLYPYSKKRFEDSFELPPALGLDQDGAGQANG